MLNPVFSIDRLRAFLDARWDKTDPVAIYVEIINEIGALAAYPSVYP
jgi:hypothetical protein